MEHKPLERSIHRLTITGYGSDGAGVARLDGMAVFVPGALVGETCSVQLTKVGRNAIWGKVTSVKEASPHRIERDCPHYGQCGGCQTRHMDYDEELRFKAQRIEDALRRIGGTELTLSAVHGAAQTCRYRNKAQFPVGEGPKLGFYQPRSHQVVDTDDCLLQSSAAMDLRRAVKAWMGQYGVSAYQETTGRGLVRHLFVRTNRAGESLCCLLVNGSSLPQEEALVAALRAAVPNLVGVVLGENRRRTNVILGERYRTLWGADALTDTLCGLTFSLSVPSFFQVNPDQTEVLYRRAVDFAGLTGTETVLDLYCGVGTIGLLMAQGAGQVIGGEVIPQAVLDAEENQRRNGITNARFLQGDAGEIAQRLQGEGIVPQVICVDPPRKGLEQAVVETIAGMNPLRIVYVSCDPATLARDMARFRTLGYTATKAEAVDLFPRTSHVETVALLTRDA